MLFNTLNKLRRTMVMMILFLLFAGLTMFVVPVSYIPGLGKILGFFFLILAILKILDFISSNKSMISYFGLPLFVLAGFAVSIALAIYSVKKLVKIAQKF